MDDSSNPRVIYAEHFYPTCLGLLNADEQNAEDSVATRLLLFPHFLEYVWFEDDLEASCRQQMQLF
jgi:hypothetical protein